jgi:hypothetical protein
MSPLEQEYVYSNDDRNALLTRIARCHFDRLRLGRVYRLSRYVRSR